MKEMKSSAVENESAAENFDCSFDAGSVPIGSSCPFGVESRKCS